MRCQCMTLADISGSRGGQMGDFPTKVTMGSGKRGRLGQLKVRGQHHFGGS